MAAYEKQRAWSELFALAVREGGLSATELEEMGRRVGGKRFGARHWPAQLIAIVSQRIWCLVNDISRPAVCSWSMRKTSQRPWLLSFKGMNLQRLSVL